MSKNVHQLFELSNGLRLLHVPVPESPAVFVAITGNVGRRAEEDNEIGAAHFLEHLFFDGTPKRPTAFDLSKIVLASGIVLLMFLLFVINKLLWLPLLHNATKYQVES